MGGERKTEKQSFNYESENVVMRQPLRAQSLDTQAVSGTRAPAVAAARGWRELEQSFYFWMSLLVFAIVVYGFHFTVGDNLFHPATPRPWILYVHAALFSSWLIFFIVQSALVRTRNTSVHKRLGWFGLGMGILMPIVGVATAIAMGRLHTLEGSKDQAQALAIPLNDLVVFSIAFGLAFYWRKRPEFHRRLVLVATCALTAAAFGRFPEAILPQRYFYSGVDVLVLLGVARDLLVTRRVHPVYLYALPLMMLGQTAATYAYLTAWPPWVKFGHAVLGI
jgi:hypothetical protein